MRHKDTYHIFIKAIRALTFVAYVQYCNAFSHLQKQYSPQIGNKFLFQGEYLQIRIFFLEDIIHVTNGSLACGKLTFGYTRANGKAASEASQQGEDLSMLAGKPQLCAKLEL